MRFSISYYKTDKVVLYYVFWCRGMKVEAWSGCHVLILRPGYCIGCSALLLNYLCSFQRIYIINID
jgi:hypothetical protein